MGNNKLYIIGNGFDLQHGIPSEYCDFKAFVHERNPYLLKSVEEYLPAGDDWRHLENALAAIDVDSIVESLENLMPSYGARRLERFRPS